MTKITNVIAQFFLVIARNEGHIVKTVHDENHHVKMDAYENQRCLAVRSMPKAMVAWPLMPIPKNDAIPLICRNRKEDRTNGRKQINVQIDVRREISI